jgi:hypothetical protein
VIKNTTDFLFFLAFSFMVNKFGKQSHTEAINHEIEELHQFLLDEHIEPDEIDNLLLLRAENITFDTYSEVDMSLGLSQSG